MPTKKTTETKKTPQENLSIKIKKLEEELTRLKTEITEKNDKYLRILADYQNYEKRAEKEKTNCEEELKRKYLLYILDFHELLKKAYEDESPKEGLKILTTTLEKFLQQEGIQYIECKGKPFDHCVHHAISVIEKDDCTDGIIIDEIKKGYMASGKLLRPSQVIVVKKKETP